MSGDTTDQPAPERRPSPRGIALWLLRAAGLVFVALMAIVAAALLLLDTSIGHRFVVEQIAALRPADGMRYSIGRIRGSLYGRATLVNVTIRDPKGVVLTAPLADLDWTPFAWIANRLEIHSLIVPAARLEKLPEPRATGRKRSLVPNFDVDVGALAINRLALAPSILGKQRMGRLRGQAYVRGGRAILDLRAAVEGTDKADFRLDVAPDKDRFDIDATVEGAADGLIARLAGVRKPLSLRIAGDGGWRDWHGTASGSAGDKLALALQLRNQAGTYQASGRVFPGALYGGALARLAPSGARVEASGTFANRRIDGALRLATNALSLGAEGQVDLARNRYRMVKLLARLTRPEQLAPTLHGGPAELRAIIDGGFGDASVDYRLVSPRLVTGKIGFEAVRGAGRGRIASQGLALPVALQAARITGAGQDIEALSQHLAITGTLRGTMRELRASDVTLRTDRLSATGRLSFSPGSGSYLATLDARLPNYPIPGVGTANATATITVRPAPGQRGVALSGVADVQVPAISNGFFRSLAGGSARLASNFALGPDGILHLEGLRLTGPSVQLAGSGIRRTDGTVQLALNGTQTRYGPVQATIDGPLERPAIALNLAHPDATLGLRDVVLHLDPTAQGFDFAGNGGSIVGAFTAKGAIDLPKGGDAVIRLAPLTASGVQVNGALTARSGGLDGVLTLREGGVGGDLTFRPDDGRQQIVADLTVDRASLGSVDIRRGRINLVAMLDPDGAAVEGDFRLGGIRRDRLRLSRIVGAIKLRDGIGRLTAQLSGARGRAFDINSVVDITPDRFAISAEGTIDRRAVKLDRPAIVTRDGDGWRLAEARLLFAGGEADLSGFFTSQSAAIDARMARFPLATLDLAYPDLGLDGVASGTLSFRDARDAAPTGKLDLTIRSLSRSGLVQTSKPIDMGLVAVLQPDTAVMRAVMESDGQTIGRAQARLSPLSGATVVARLANAPLFAQLRYNGPADTLWRLTGIEFFDLSGPVAIGADISGHLNDPRIRGAMRTSGARIESATTGTVLTNVTASGQFSGSRLAIANFTAEAGKGGKVTGSGSFDFAAVNGFGIDIDADASNAVLINRDDIAATGTGDLHFKSDGSGGLISGKLTLNRARYRLGQAAAATAVPKLNIREINLPGGNEEDETPRRPWRLDIAARASSGVFVTGLGLSSEWSADLAITGEPENPGIAGRADLVRGTYEFAGREFALARGAIRFGGETPPNPTLDIQATADTTGLNATIRVAGPATRPQISFASTPALPEDELLSRLLFGTSITNLSAPEALQLASAVAALRDGGNGLNPINAVRRAVGLDRLRILPADTQLGRQTSVAAGKYVTRRLYAEIITDGQGYSATQVEFQVTRWLSVLSTVSTLGRTSANVRVSKDY